MTSIPALDTTDIFAYIRDMWSALTRSHATIAQAAADPKFKAPPGGRWPVYIAARENREKVESVLRASMAAEEFRKIELRMLPESGEPVREAGLLYLPRPYVVPGGRFNELYGWDSYFIQVGLLRDHKLQLAKDMADNVLYEIRKYGKILNANRTYYLTRSQPPFLTPMLVRIYERTKDKQWLEASVPAIESYYQYWTTSPHLTPETGLSRYYDLGSGPAPEVVSSELDQDGHSSYELVKEWFRTHQVSDYDISQFYDAGRDELTEEFYQGDRSMRESGFDPSNRFGPFSAATTHYNPVCLNSLLYLMEVQTAEILKILGRGEEARSWLERASVRASTMNRLLWDDSHGLYLDYDFTQESRRDYPFLTTFYPLWTGIATDRQAARVVANLPLFEKEGGLQTSTLRTGDQWDAPYGWSPLQWIAVQGMRRYGFEKDAERVSQHFLSLVLQQFMRDGEIMEKYDVCSPGRDVSRGLRFGYHTNEAGFGWSNAVFTSLFDELSSAGRSTLRRQAGTT